MRIALVHGENHSEAVKAAAARAGESGTDYSFFVAPDLLKAALAAKNGLSNCEACVVLLVAREGDADSLTLLQEKLLDVELAERKPIFLEVIIEGEWRTDEEFASLAEEKIREAHRKALTMQPAAIQVPDWMPGGAPMQEETQAAESEALDFMGDEVGEKLF
ncbi:MAG: hypothetical protein WC607_04065 [Candidatus Micrarchaeia archaeon]